MSEVLSIFSTIVARVISHIVCKWLDRKVLNKETN